MGTVSDPHPIDLHVGSRIRKRRVELEISLESLAKSIGVVHQQVQRHETGGHRVFADQLLKYARALDVPVDWFFEELPRDWRLIRKPERTPTVAVGRLWAYLELPETKALLKAFGAIKASEQRRGTIAMVRAAVTASPRSAIADNVPELKPAARTRRKRSR